MMLTPTLQRPSTHR